MTAIGRHRQISGMTPIAMPPPSAAAKRLDRAHIEAAHIREKRFESPLTIDGQRGTDRQGRQEMWPRRG